jgi:hypothetical protein
MFLSIIKQQNNFNIYAGFYTTIKTVLKAKIIMNVSECKRGTSGFGSDTV